MGINHNKNNQKVLKYKSLVYNLFLYFGEISMEFEVKNDKNKTFKVVTMSDTHDNHHKINMQALPPGDIFIHAGDFTKYSQPH